MREYQTTGTVRVNSGYIGLDKRQAAARAGSINSVSGKKGVYEVVRPIEFKAGEKIRMENPDKYTLSKMNCLDVPTPEPKSEFLSGKPVGKKAGK